jgi:hypothetical protein
VQTQVTADHAPVPQQRWQDVLAHVDGNGEADPLGRLDNRRVDSDDVPAAVHERAARVPGVQGRVGLDHVVHQVPGDATERPPDGAHDPGGQRGLEAERAADRHHELADAQPAGVAERRVWKRLPVRPDQGEIGPGVIADDPSGDLLPVVQTNPDAVGVSDDVVVREQIAFGRKQDTGPGTQLPAAADAQIHDGGAQGIGHPDDYLGEGVEGGGLVRGRARVRLVKRGVAVIDEVLPELRHGWISLQGAVDDAL